MRKEIIGDATLYLGDCMEVMQGMGDESVDVTVTSPPYNMGLIPGGGGKGMYKPGANNKAGRFRDGYGIHSDALPQSEYDQWQRECLAQMWRISKEAVFYNHRPRVEHGTLRTPLSFNFGEAILRQIIIWDRGTGIDVNLRHYCTRQEWIFLFAKPTFSLASHSASGCGDVWRLGMEHSETGHPAPFPVALPEMVIQTTEASTVFDPFMGSGSSGVACARRGKKFIGSELEPKYFDIACRRIEHAHRQAPLFEPELIIKREQTGLFA